MLWLSYISLALLLLIGLVLIFIILLQRGRGGGLAGALGGMGGQSAFGTKAGDMFTRITVVLAVIWIVLCAGQIPLLRAVSGSRFKGGSAASDLIESAPIKEAGASDPKTKSLDAPLGDLEKSDAEKTDVPDEKPSIDDDKPEAEKASEKPDQPAEKSATEEPAKPPAEETPKDPAAEKSAPESAAKPDAEPEQKNE